MQHSGELDAVTLEAATKQTQEGTPEGDTVRKLKSMYGNYNDMFDEGYFDALHPEKGQKRRCELVAEFMGNDAVKDILTSERIAMLFPNTPPGVRKTKLPLSIGSYGYDAETDYTIKSHLPANSLCSIYGPSGSYKSFLAVSWSCHIATGMKWAGKRVTGGSVIYVVGEGGIGVKRRIKAWEYLYNDGNHLKNLYRVDRPVFPVRAEEVKEMIIAAKQVEAETGQPVRLIVIDTLARCFGGNDENDARDMGAFIEGCDTIKRETGATLLVVHHSGKDEGKGARGSSAFRAALDAEFNVRREGEGGALILTCTKMKDAEEPGQCAYDLKPIPLFTDSDDEDVFSLVVVDVPREARGGDPALESVKNMTGNHATLWQCIRSRKAKGEPCNRAVVRDDIIALLGESGRKSFPRWFEKLVRDELIEVSENGDIVMTGKE
ncbi:AAA family ATPase [Salmonella enterica]|nr:AAA family ATPase [Salmonella enterica]EHI9909933.1 AAA family ATPase [Salmonella enterica]EHJ0910802.1 AAA family ATPase [Salmonella enterica]